MFAKMSTGRAPAVISSALVALLATSVFWTVDRHSRGRYLAEERARAENLLEPYGNIAEFAIDRGIGGVDALVAFAESRPSFSPEDFRRFAARIYSDARAVRIISIAPDGVSNYVFPIEENEIYLGRNLYDDPRPEVRAHIEKTLRTTGTTMSAPYVRLDGRTGIAARRAIRQGGEVWGVASIVMDLDSLIGLSRLSRPPQGTVFALRDSTGEMLFGAPEVFDRSLASSRIDVPGRHWELAIAPTAAWEPSYRGNLFVSRVTGTAAVLVLSAFTYFVADRNRRLRREVGRVTADLSRTNRDLRESEANVRAFLDAIPETGILLDTDGTILLMNEVAAERIGRPLSALIGANCFDAMPESRVRDHRPSFDEVIRSGEPKRFEDERDGRVTDNYVYPVRDASGAVVRVAVLRIDITERKRTEEALGLTETRYRIAIANSPVMVCAQDRDLRYTWVDNPGPRFSVDDLVGRTDDDIFAPEDAAKIVAFKRSAIERDTAVHGEVSAIWQGEPIVHALTVEPHRDERGDVDGIAVAAIDITERKRIEEELQLANDELAIRMRELVNVNWELESFSYSVSHDLRAPLRRIDGYVEILQEDHAEALDEEGRHCLERTRVAVARMKELIGALLKLSRVARVEIEPEPVDLTALAMDILQELQLCETDRQATITVMPGLVVKGAPDLFRVALENLLGNAWKYTRKKERTEIDVGAIDENGMRVYYVADNGAGFSMSNASRLFGAFQRLHTEQEFEGTGIGLATVRRIIHHHGGEIWAEAAVNEGATFYFTIGETRS